jgi:protein-L-isoaspartate(D-aspartate) O-methyltransferase
VTKSPEVLSRRLVDDLVEQGRLSERWAAVLHVVPRHLFVPDVIYLHDESRDGNDLVPFRRTEHPDEWLRMVYSDEPINTQVNNGYPDRDGTGREVTSSCSQPVVVAEMLDELAALPGERVLEIGTGTGWNAALLAHLVGAANVTTVEIDPVIAAHARAALDKTGYSAVTSVIGDGAAGWAAGAPYDRLISTVGVTSIPYAWVEQVGHGGRVVAPLRGTYQPPGIVALNCNDGVASGRLAGPAAFMALRAEHVSRLYPDKFTAAVTAETTTDLHPYHYVSDRDAATAIGQRVEGVYRVWQASKQPNSSARVGMLRLYCPADGSWACVVLMTEPPYPVEQAGPRRLFNEVETAYRWWQQAGKPAVEDWLVTVGPAGQQITLNPPD